MKQSDRQTALFESKFTQFNRNVSNLCGKKSKIREINGDFCREKASGIKELRTRFYKIVERQFRHGIIHLFTVYRKPDRLAEIHEPAVQEDGSKSNPQSKVLSIPSKV